MSKLKVAAHSRKPIPMEVVEKIQRELKAGFTRKSVAENNNVSLSTIKNIKRKMSTERSTKNLSDFIKNDTLSL